MKAENYLIQMSKQIHSGRVRSEIMQEYENHIEDCKEALMAKGMNADEAEEEAVRQMGDPVVAGKEMGRLYRGILDLKMLMFFWGMSILAALLYLGVKWVETQGDAKWIVFSLGTPEMTMMVNSIIGSVFLTIGFLLSAVEKWNNLNTFYAWARDWNGGGIVNSAIIMMIGIYFVSVGRGFNFILIMTFVFSLGQLGQRAVIELYRHKKEAELLWEMGNAETDIFPYKGKGNICGKNRRVVCEMGNEIPKGTPIMIVGLDGMKPVVTQL